MFEDFFFAPNTKFNTNCRKTTAISLYEICYIAWKIEIIQKNKKMNILHITDLHYNSKSSEKLSQERLIQKLCESLKKIEHKIDLVFFTGDLVFNGSIANDFLEAREVFLDKISIALTVFPSSFNFM